MPSVRRASARRACTWAVWRAFHVRCACSSGRSIPFRHASLKGATETVNGEAAVVAVAEAEEREHVLALRAADLDLAVESHERVDARAAARPAPIQCARPESVMPSQKANATRFWSGSYPSPTTPSTAPVSLRMFATWRGTCARLVG